MKQATIQLEQLTCPSCVRKIENATKLVEGVEASTVEVLFNTGRVRFDFDEDKVSVSDVEKTIEALGFEVIKSRVK